jgi:hypothetical protein
MITPLVSVTAIFFAIMWKLPVTCCNLHGWDTKKYYNYGSEIRVGNAGQKSGFGKPGQKSGNPGEKSGQKSGSEKPGQKSGWEIRVGNPEIRVRNPGRNPGRKNRVKNPDEKSGSEIRKSGNPGQNSGSEIRVKNPGEKSGSEMPVGNSGEDSSLSAYVTDISLKLPVSAYRQFSHDPKKYGCYIKVGVIYRKTTTW